MDYAKLLVAGTADAPIQPNYFAQVAAHMVDADTANGGTYRDVLTGTGHFRAVAALSALRWTARMFLLVILVSITHSVMAAVAGSIATTLLELLVASRLQPLTLRGPPGLAASRLWGVAGPLLVFSAALQLETKVDLFALSALGGSTTDVGYYSAAQNLAVPPSLFALGFAPLLLATLSRLERGAHHHEACVVARASLRVCLALIPLAAIVAGASGEIVRVIFGSAFIGAAPLLALLFAATVALATTAVSVSIVTVSAQPSRVSLLGVLLIGSALTGHAVLIPRMGPQGAALATAASATLSACASLTIVHHTWRIHAYGTAIRATIAAVPLYWAASLIHTTTWFTLILKLVLLSLVGMSALLLLGELGAEEKQRVWALLHVTTSA